MAAVIAKKKTKKKGAHRIRAAQPPTRDELARRAKERGQVDTCSMCEHDDQPIWWWDWDTDDAVCFECGGTWIVEVLGPINRLRALARRVDRVIADVIRRVGPATRKAKEKLVASVQGKLMPEGTVDTKKLDYWEKRLGLEAR